ncbi:alkaline phosphatase family protein [Persicimonas caeni]|uniref:Alkaline phosphatase family protein n=1 Tax=Persicimonas caeni TaxID=2292766 RepID=A0A4Y6PZX4_PERCE|nr:alkaline phosphatase family protein [Persicimonas caeni]QDG53864.1 alkaline phosphatase family protein [Persicimonas caeni]QED35085.1 alkaline phosphatase family protein [Persicimonas caeni]
MHSKKVLLVIVDALTAEVYDDLLSSGKLPHLSRLHEHGTYRGASLSIFPSITPAATSTLITGRYPREHGIQGAYWLDEGTDEVVYFGSDFWVVLQHGGGEFLRDFLYHLNQDRLQAETLFQTVERAGREACSLNYLIHRGDTPHEIDLPWLVDVMPGLPSSTEICGPSRMFLGDFLDTLPIDDVQTDSIVEEISDMYGMDDTHTGEALARLARQGAMPDMTLAYFPENDFASHEKGPFPASPTVEGVDAHIGRFIEAYGGLDAVLEDFCIVLTGDHSQCDIVDNKDTAGIMLDDLLADFHVADYGTPLEAPEELAICPNLRASQIYLASHEPAFVERVEDTLLADERIDQVIRRQSFEEGAPEAYLVRTAERGELQFRPGDAGPKTARDAYGFQWSWQGSLSAVDGRVETGELVFDKYPNAFERIAGGPGSTKSADLWVTAQPGFEFGSRDAAAHVGGGSHGSLHLYDSISPLLVVGAPDHVDVPKLPRAVDIHPICSAALGIDAPTSPGDSHAARWFSRG